MMETTCVETPTTQEIEQLEAHLRSQLGNRISSLRVLIRDGGLVLSGQTRTYYAKQLAQHALMAATSCPLGSNEIEVS
jgi:hypothetical protein